MTSAVKEKALSQTATWGAVNGPDAIVDTKKIDALIYELSILHLGLNIDHADEQSIHNHIQTLFSNPSVLKQKPLFKDITQKISTSKQLLAHMEATALLIKDFVNSKEDVKNIYNIGFIPSGKIKNTLIEIGKDINKIALEETNKRNSNEEILSISTLKNLHAGFINNFATLSLEDNVKKNQDVIFEANDGRKYNVNIKNILHTDEIKNGYKSWLDLNVNSPDLDCAMELFTQATLLPQLKEISDKLKDSLPKIYKDNVNFLKELELFTTFHINPENPMESAKAVKENGNRLKAIYVTMKYNLEQFRSVKLQFNDLKVADIIRNIEGVLASDLFDEKVKNKYRLELLQINTLVLSVSIGLDIGIDNLLPFEKLDSFFCHNRHL